MIETHINNNTLKVHVLTLKLCNEKELSGLTNVSDLLWPVEALDDIFPYHKQYILKIWYFKDKMNLFFFKDSSLAICDPENLTWIVEI